MKETTILHDHILDPKIEPIVRVLQEHGVHTVQSCQGGEGHSYDKPTVEFSGVHGEGYRALGIAIIHGFPVTKFSQKWRVSDGILSGPYWAMEFNPPLLADPTEQEADSQGDIVKCCG